MLKQVSNILLDLYSLRLIVILNLEIAGCVLKSCDRPPRHRFFLVSLCLKANAEMVPKIPSCHYMLLM